MPHAGRATRSHDDAAALNRGLRVRRCRSARFVASSLLGMFANAGLPLASAAKVRASQSRIAARMSAMGQFLTKKVCPERVSFSAGSGTQGCGGQ